MNKYEKLVQKQFLNDEEKIIKRLKSVYNQSLKDINSKVAELDTSISTLQKVYNSVGDDEIGELAAAFLKSNQIMTPEEAKETLQSMIQSKVYQKKYQEALKKQVGGVLDTMQAKEFKAVSEYLTECYENGFVGTMYDLQGQGIPLCFPMDQESMVRAVQLDSKISKGLYERLGEDVDLLKRKITAQVSRGISSGLTFKQVAQELAGTTNIGFNNAVRIARTEGHRIQCQAGMDACYKAKDKGADVLKQWDAALDSRTRESHTIVDGEIRELDEKFSNGLMFPGDPSGGAAEVINCRCALLQRARWALDDDELQTLKDRAAYYGLDKTDNFEDFKKKYLKAAEAEPQTKPKKEYLTEKKLKQNIDDADAHLSDLHDQFKKASGGVEYDDIIDNFGSLDDFAKGDQLAAMKAIKKQMDDLEIAKADWQEKLNTKLFAKETKKLKKEQILLQDQLDNFDIKTYSNIWKDDVTTADWENLNIAGKKKYYEGKFITETNPDKLKEFQDLYKQLQELDDEGKKYYEIQQKLTKTKADLAILKKNGKVVTTAAPSANEKVFLPDAYGQRKTDAWNKRFRDKDSADNYYRPLLDAEWNNLTDEEKFSVWQYTHNSHPINRPLSGYDGKWGSRSRNYKGLDAVRWDNESGTNYDAVLYSNDFIRKFANGKSSQWGGDIRNYSDVISDLTKTIDKSALKDDLWLVRGSDTDGFAGLLDGNIISFKQVENLVNSGDVQTLKKLVQNEIFQTHSFVSTGIAEGTGFNGNITYKIYAPKGTKGIYAEPQSYFGGTIGQREKLYSPGMNFNRVGGEAEVILQRGTSFRITDVKSKGYNDIEITMEVVDQPDYFKTGYEHTFDGGLTSEK